MQNGITLRTPQLRAASFLADEMARGGHFDFTAPTGCGRSLIVAHAAARQPGRVAYLARLSALAHQMRDILVRCGVSNVDVFEHPRQTPDLTSYGVVVLSECLRHRDAPNHPTVVRLS